MKLQILSLLFVTGLAAAQTPVYTDVNAPADKRADGLVAKMTLTEKVSQMQYEAPAIQRLGIPAYNWSNEALHGVAFNGLATCFVQAIGLAAMWDRQLMHEVASVISDEGRAKYNICVSKGQRGNHQGLTFWSPNINIFRDPRWGRGQETYGEDPYLTGQMAVQFIRGLQGDDPKYLKTVATCKHFAVHSGPESLRHQFEVSVSEYDLRETYLPAFKAGVVDGKVSSLMCAYNSLRGKACCGNDPLLNDILRKEWGFTGYVVSDCGAIGDIVHGHKQAPDAPEASAMAVKAGTDLECGRKYSQLVSAVNRGLISEASLDTSLKRLFTARIKLGMFDPPSMVPFSKMGAAELDSKKNREMALKAARASIVLLKNNKNILPLNKATRTIAVIGPDANNAVVLLGNYNGVPSHTVTPLEGITKAVSGKTKILYAQGCGIFKPSNSKQQAALKAAAKADVVVMCMGISPQLEGEENGVQIEGFSHGDRTTLDLPACQQNLIKQVAALGKPIVLVFVNGSALSINWEKENFDAIVEAWYGGEAAGTALADVLFGDYNPSGRLPITFYKSVTQLPAFTDYNMAGRTYRYFSGDVLYPFGYGLSYTSFAFSNIRAEGKVLSDHTAKVKVEVKNTGNKEGEEVIELYVKGKGAIGHDAIKTLRGFEKISLQPNETKTVEFTVSAATLTFYREGSGFTLDKGEHTLMVGSSSADSDLKEVKMVVE